jgi:hypothetical protein
MSGAYINGRITCRFQRLINVNSQGRRKRQTNSDTVYPLDTASYFVLLAQGPASGGTWIIRKLEAACIV